MILSTLERLTKPLLALGSSRRGAKRRIASHRVLAFAAWLGLLALAWPSGAFAQAPFLCPLNPYEYPERCARLAQRAQREQDRQTRNDAIEAYRETHPWRVSALLDTSLFGLGLAETYMAGAWGVGVGASVLHELLPGWSLRMDALARFGRGHISDWGFDDPGPVEKSTGFIGGAELRVALLKRTRSFYFGPALSAGVLVLRRQSLYDADFPVDFEQGLTIRVPQAGAFLAAGLVVGGEPIPDGRYSISLHLTPGAWNDLRHLYLSAALDVTIKLWD